MVSTPFQSPFKGVGPTVSVGKNWTIKRGPARKVSTIVGFSLYPLLKEHVGEICRQGVLLAAKAGETRGELELSMGTRVHHPGLRSGEDTLSHGHLVSSLMP